MSLHEPALNPGPTQASSADRGTRRRRLLAACVGVLVVGSLAALVKSQVDERREAARRTDSV